MDTRRYAVINKITRGAFNAVKAAGVLQDDLDTCRLSLDGTKMIIKWYPRNNISLAGFSVHFQGSLEELKTYIANNKNDWEPDIIFE